MFKLRYIIISILALSLAECQSPSDQTFAKPESDETTEVNYFPLENDANSIHILLAQSYHSDEINVSSLRTKQWMELIKLGNNYALVNSSVRYMRTHDPIMDEEYEMTGWDVTSDHPETSVLLIEKYPFLKEHQVEHLATNVWIDFNQEKTYRFNNINYRLFATGNKENQTNYQLFVESEKDGKKWTTLLVSIPTLDDKQTMIHFIGDIDNDGRLDYIIDTARKYNGETLTLYLSQPTDSKSLCIPVGQIASVGC